MSNKWTCTDCNDVFSKELMRDGHRCPMCGCARTVEMFQRTSTKIGDVTVNFTFGRLPKTAVRHEDW